MTLFYDSRENTKTDGYEVFYVSTPDSTDTTKTDVCEPSGLDMEPGIGLNTSVTVSSPGPPQGLVSDTVYWPMLSVVLGLDMLAGLLATGANVVTLVVYSKMGFADSTNISLAALAVSDFGVAVTAVICVFPPVSPLIPNAPFTHDIFLAPAAYPHVFFARISAMITTYISLERYLCVLLPLKVKTIITNRKTLIAMVIIFGSVFCFYPLVYIRYPIGWKFDPYKNRTVLGTILNNDAIALLSDKIRSLVTSAVLPFSTFIMVSLLTVLLALSLQKSKAWRDANKSITPKTQDKTGGHSDSEKSQSKEARAVKMVITIAVVFIVTNFPSSIHTITAQTLPGFTITGRYSRLYEVCGMMFVGLNAVNSGSNVIIYVKMSNKFRQAMLKTFCKRVN